MTITDYPNFTPQVYGAGTWRYETVNPFQRTGLFYMAIPAFGRHVNCMKSNRTEMLLFVKSWISCRAILQDSLKPPIRQAVSGVEPMR